MSAQDMSGKGMSGTGVSARGAMADEMRPQDPDHLPPSTSELPRYAGVPTFMRLPHRTIEAPGATEIGLIGVPWDGGTTNRPGARHGPRAVRDASTMLRMVNQATAAAPFHTAACADLGDVAASPFDIGEAIDAMTARHGAIRAANIRPLAVGGDHTISLPALRAAGADGAVGMVHFDAHTDLFDGYFGGGRYTHGTPFRRAIEEGVLDPARTVQIGIRGTSYGGDDRAFAREHGVRIVPIEEWRARGPADVMAEAREIVGDAPVHLSFDIDAIDPSQAPGTGTPEVGGIGVGEAQEALRMLDGLDLIGADLVEVSPPFDVGGVTAWAAASLLFEILCVLAPAAARAKGREPVLCAPLLP